MLKGSCLIDLPTAGVFGKLLGVYFTLLLTAGICEQHLGRDLKILLMAGVCEQCLSLVLRPGHCQNMRLVSSCGPQTFALRGCMRPAFRRSPETVYRMYIRLVEYPGIAPG